MSKKVPKLDIENGIYPDRFPGDDLPENVQIHVADIAAEQGLDRDLISKYVILGGHQYWLASHYKTGVYFTKNANDPKVQDFSKGTPKARGFLKFVKEGGNSLGRPRGSKNRISVQQACESLGANPAEFLVGIMKGDIGTLKRYNIRNPKEVTVAQKMKSAEILLHKLAGNIKSVDLDSDGNPVGTATKDQEETKQTVQVYLPEKGSSVKIELSEREAEQIAGVKDVGKYLEEHLDNSSLDIEQDADFYE
jgi:hypothetical protein